MIEQVRSREEYEAIVEASIKRELQRARDGELLAVSSRAAASFLGKHKDTLRDWRQPPPKGPPFEKGADGIGVNNEHVSYPWAELVAWKKARAGKTAKERKLQDELEKVMQKVRELELELQLQDAKDSAAKLAKRLGRKLGFATLGDTVAEEDWVTDGHLIIGHVLTVDDAMLVKALDADLVISASLADALSLPWDYEAREPFEIAWRGVLKTQLDAVERGEAMGREVSSKLSASQLGKGTLIVDHHGERRSL